MALFLELGMLFHSGQQRLLSNVLFIQFPISLLYLNLSNPKVLCPGPPNPLTLSFLKFVLQYHSEKMAKVIVIFRENL